MTELATDFPRQPHFLADEQVPAERPQQQDRPASAERTGAIFLIAEIALEKARARARK